MIYLTAPYWHKNKIIRAARFKATSELMGDLIKSGTEVFCDVVYIHTLLETNPNLEFEDLNWYLLLKPFRRFADSLGVYQLPGWEQDRLVNSTHNYFALNGDKIQVWAPKLEHSTGPYLETWKNI